MDLKQCLVKGFQYGFSIGCDTTPSVPLSKNHSTALHHSEVINLHIQKSLELNRIAGPFPHPPFDQFISSPLGVVPKSEPGQFKIIHDLSYTQRTIQLSFIFQKKFRLYIMPLLTG